MANTIPPLPSPPAADIPVIRFREIESTSSLARRLAETGQLRSRPAMIVAESQTGGVGRFKRQWTSPVGGLWCTLAFPLRSGAPGDAIIEGLGLRVGVAITTVIRAVLDNQTKRPADVRLKWPNDVLINARKVAGILCELVNCPGAVGPGRAVLVGVGINANLSSAMFPAELRDRVTGLLDHMGRPLDLELLRQAVQSALLEALAAHALPPDLLRTAREMLFGVGAPAVITLPQGRKVHGTLIGIDHSGMAQLRTDDGLFTAPSGTVLMFDE